MNKEEIIKRLEQKQIELLNEADTTDDLLLAGGCIEFEEFVSSLLDDVKKLNETIVSEETKCDIPDNMDISVCCVCNEYECICRQV